MDDLISRQAAIDAVGYYSLHSGDKLLFADNALKDLPSAQPERKNGKWTEWWSGDCALIMTGEEMLWKCSECDSKYIQKSNFCPNCGADNRGEEDESSIT